MKRNIVINGQRTSICVSDDLCGAVKEVAKNTEINDEILAFDTQLHICYAYIKVSNGYSIIETQVPLADFRSFYLVGSFHDIYASLLISMIK